MAGGFDGVNLNVFVIEKFVKKAHGVGATADAGDQGIRRPPLLRHQLRPHFAADDGLKIPHHGRVRMRSGNCANDIKCIVDIRDPVTQRLVHRILECRGAGRHRYHLRAKQLHAKDIGCLSLDIGLAHIDNAGQAEPRAHGRCGDAVLTSAGFRDDAGFAHPPGQQDLAHGVVDLVRAGVVELISLEINLGAAQIFGQALG